MRVHTYLQSEGELKAVPRSGEVNLEGNNIVIHMTVGQFKTFREQIDAVVLTTTPPAQETNT